MGNTAANVSTGKPNVSGAVYVAPASTTVPTDATTALDTTKYVCMGYVSEDGLENANDLSFSDIKAWGGVVVYKSLTDFGDTFKLALLESENEDVLGLVYGSGNVDVDANTGEIEISVKNSDPEEHVFVFELALRGNKKKRIVIPSGAITAREAIKYTDSDAIKYGITVSAYPDANGLTHTEYIA